MIDVIINKGINNRDYLKFLKYLILIKIQLKERDFRDIILINSMSEP